MKWIAPSKEQIIEAIEEFNTKNSCQIPHFVADSFINYYKQENGGWIMANGKPLKDWKRALNSTWLPKMRDKYKVKGHHKELASWLEGKEHE